MTAQIDHFGTGADGRRVDAVRLGRGPLQAVILTRGAILQDLRLAPFRHALTLGAADLAAYEGPMSSFGAIVGPVANRIGGARAEIDGKQYTFEANLAGKHTLHGGAGNTHKRVWDIVSADAGSVTLSLDLADGLGGFPGNRRITAAYRLTDAPALELAITAVTDAPTLMNPAFHGYWNLGGGPDWGGHRLRVAAKRVLETDADNLPTGRILDVEGTGFDFREARTVKPGLTVRLDNNFCVAPVRRKQTPVLWLGSPDGRLTLEVATTEPGIQVFDAATVGSGAFPGHSGAPYGPCSGLAFEPQFWPDAPNRPEFPSILLCPGEEWRQASAFRFTAA